MPEKAPLGELIVGIIDRPGQTLANVVAHPRWRWLFPTALAVVALVVYTIVAAPLMAVQAQQAMAEALNRMSGSQAAQVRAQMATFQSPVFVGGSALIVGLIGMVLGWLIQAGVLYFSALIVGGDLQFAPVFAAVPWLYVPLALESLLQAAYVAAKGKLLVNQGLSYLVSSGNATQDARNLAYVALSQVTLFRLWQLVLVYFLFRGAARLGRGAACWLTVVYLILTVGGQLAIAALGRLITPG